MLCLVVQAPPKGKKKKPTGGVTAAGGGGGAPVGRRGDGEVAHSDLVRDLSPQVSKIVTAIEKRSGLLFLEGDLLKRARNGANVQARKSTSVAADNGGRGRPADSRHIASGNRVKSLVAIRPIMGPVLESLRTLITAFSLLPGVASHPAHRAILTAWTAIQKSFEYKSADFYNKRALEERFLKQLDFIYAFACVFSFFHPFESDESTGFAFAAVKNLYEGFLDIRDTSGDLAEIQGVINAVTAPLRGEPGVMTLGGGAGVFLEDAVIASELAPVLPEGPLSALYWDILSLNKQDGSLDASAYPERLYALCFTDFDWYSLTEENFRKFYRPLHEKLMLPSASTEKMTFVVQKKLAESVSGIVCETVQFLHAKYHESGEDLARQCFNIYFDFCLFKAADFICPVVANIYYHRIELLREKFDRSDYIFTRADFDFIGDACLTREIHFKAMYFKISRIPFLPEDETWLRSPDYANHEQTIRLYLACVKDLVEPYARPFDVTKIAPKTALLKRSPKKDIDSERLLLINKFGYFSESAGAGRGHKLDFCSSMKPKWLIRVEQLCEALPLHLHLLSYNMFVYAYLYGSYEADDLERFLRDILNKYKELAYTTDRDHAFSAGAVVKKGVGDEVSRERLMIIVSAIKRLLFVREEELAQPRRLAAFNEIFGLSLTPENYLKLQQWFGFTETAEAGLEDLDFFLSAFPGCSSLRDLLGSYREDTGK